MVPKAKFDGGYHFPSNHVVVSGGGAYKEKNKLEKRKGLKVKVKNRIREKCAIKNKGKL